MRLADQGVEKDGTPVEGVTSVTLGEGEGAYELVKGTDYDVYYVNNDRAGTATAFVVGKAPNFMIFLTDETDPLKAAAEDEETDEGDEQ